jgi:micrococcal nuclease|tara:strand:+ start:8817 stop:9254 length:438 start_codon:yes stop_codon:yes gene_type:complete
MNNTEAVVVFLVAILAGLFGPLKAGADCDLRVQRVVDGDTFEARTVAVVSSSKHFQEISGFRLLGVDTPERGEEDFETEKVWLRDRIEGRDVEVRFSGQRKRDNFGRFLVDIYVCENGRTVSVNREIRGRGWGKVWHHSKPKPSK